MAITEVSTLADAPLPSRNVREHSGAPLISIQGANIVIQSSAQIHDPL